LTDKKLKTELVNNNENEQSVSIQDDILQKMKTLDEEYDSKIEKINSRYGGKRRMAKKGSQESGSQGSQGSQGRQEVKESREVKESMKNRCNSRKTKRN
jgi:hypothetical protein